MAQEKRMMLEAAHAAAWCERQPVLGQRTLENLLDPKPAMRVLTGEEAEKAAREHAELAALFDSLAAAQQKKKAAAAGTTTATPGGGGPVPEARADTPSLPPPTPEGA